MRVFLDANILVAVLNKEYPLFSYAAKILSLSQHSAFSLYTSPVCLAIAFYFSEKKSGSIKAREKIQILCKNLKITTVSNKVVQKTIGNPNIHDFEDGLEYYSAIDADCEVIITENLNDFYFSTVPVMNCDSFIRDIMAS